MSANALEWFGQPTSTRGAIAKAPNNRTYTIKPIREGRFMGECSYQHGHKEIVSIASDTKKLAKLCNTHNLETEMTAARFV